MATYRGLFMRLKDKHTTIQDKLKLAKFAWGNEAVVIPNKYQQILDYLSGVLVNKKKHKITSDDETAIWRTVKSFLEISRSKISVKASIIQVVTDVILLSVKSKVISSDNLELLASVISTALHLLEIPSITASHFENQCQLLSAVCQLHLVLSPSQLKLSHASSLLNTTVEVAIRSQLKHPNQIQIFSSSNEKLLVHALKCQQKCFSSQLEAFLLSYMLHRDHLDSYIAFLKHEEEPTASWSKPPPKNIITFFSILASQKMSYVATSLMPAFVQRFIQLNESEPRSCFMMLKYTLNTIIGLDLAQMDLPSFFTADEWMTCIAGYCKACKHCDLISANNDQNDITKWFCQLTEIVLQQRRNSSWFDYTTSLLSLSPLVVEKYLVTILQHALTDSVQVDEACAKSQDVFLSELLTLYLKLRRTQDLVTALISAVNLRVSGFDRINALTDFHLKLGVMFNEVPLMTLTAIWEKLMQCASDCLSSNKNGEIDSEQSEKLSFVLILITSLITHAKMFGQRSKGISGQRVELSMARMEEVILLPLSKMKNVKKISSYNKLLNAWAYAKMLFYPKWRELPLEEEGKNDTKAKGFQKLYQETDIASRVRLLLQRSNITKAGDETNQADINEASKTVLELLDFPQLTQELVFTPWTQETKEMTLAEEVIKQFKQFANLFPLTGQHLDIQAINKCADIIVSVLSFHNETESERSSVEGSSLYHEVSTFLSHPATREVKVLQSSIVAKIWSRLISLSDHTVGSPKKKKKKRDSVGPPVDSDIQMLCEFITNQNDALPNFSVDLEKMSTSFSVNKDRAPALIKILLSLDLESMKLLNLKCQLGFLTMSACIKESHQFDDDVQDLVHKGLCRCLSVPNLSEFFKNIKPEAFLTFIMELCNQKFDKRKSLLSCAVFGVMNDRLAVLSLPPLVKQLTSELREGDCKTFPDAGRVQTCALLIHNCGRYISKNYHIQEISNAAMDIFCTLSKFIIKHSLKWLDQPVERDQSVTLLDGKLSKKRRKSKSLDSSLVTLDNLGMKNRDLWQANLNCFSELLHLWTNDVADDRISEQLYTSVDTIHRRIQTDLDSDQKTDEETTITQLRFLRACCHCHQRLSQGKDPTASAETSHKSLLTDDTIEKIWNATLTLCQSELSHHVSRLQSKEIEDSSISFDDWDSWPTSLAACLDVMTSVMECITPSVFTQYLRSMMSLLVPEKNLNIPGVFIVVSVWRRLLHSTLLSEASIGKIFANVYEFLSSSLNLLLHLENAKPEALDTLAKKAQEIDAGKEVPKSSSFVATVQPAIWIPNACRFILHAMSDFVDLSKIIITPRTILLCLQAGVNISVTCTEDLEALLRLVNTFVVHHPVAAVKAAATLLSLVSKLICSCVRLGFSEHFSTVIAPQQVDKVVHCAQLVTRVLIVLASGDYKKELGKISHCALSDYIMEVQKGTLHTSVKKELVRGLYRLISVCDKYRLASLYTSLPPGVKDTFKFMHQDYEKYYRYKGNV